MVLGSIRAVAAAVKLRLLVQHILPTSLNTRAPMLTRCLALRRNKYLQVQGRVKIFSLQALIATCRMALPTKKTRKVTPLKTQRATQYIQTMLCSKRKRLWLRCLLVSKLQLQVLTSTQRHNKPMPLVRLLVAQQVSPHRAVFILLCALSVFNLARPNRCVRIRLQPRMCLKHTCLRTCRTQLTPSSAKRCVKVRYKETSCKRKLQVKVRLVVRVRLLWKLNVVVTCLHSLVIFRVKGYSKHTVQDNSSSMQSKLHTSKRNRLTRALIYKQVYRINKLSCKRKQRRKRHVSLVRTQVFKAMVKHYKPLNCLATWVNNSINKTWALYKLCQIWALKNRLSNRRLLISRFRTTLHNNSIRICSLALCPICCVVCLCKLVTLVCIRRSLWVFSSQWVRLARCTTWVKWVRKKAAQLKWLMAALCLRLLAVLSLALIRINCRVWLEGFLTHSYNRNLLINKPTQQLWALCKQNLNVALTHVMGL